VISGLSGAPGCLRSPVKNFHIRAEPNLDQELQRFWDSAAENIVSGWHVLWGDVWEDSLAICLRALHGPAPNEAGGCAEIRRIPWSSDAYVSQSWEASITGRWSERGLCQFHADLSRTGSPKAVSTTHRRFGRTNYLSHHAVKKATDPPGKLRVVFLSHDHWRIIEWCIPGQSETADRSMDGAVKVAIVPLRVLRGHNQDVPADPRPWGGFCGAKIQPTKRRSIVWRQSPMAQHPPRIWRYVLYSNSPAMKSIAFL